MEKVYCVTVGQGNVPVLVGDNQRGAGIVCVLAVWTDRWCPVLRGWHSVYKSGEHTPTAYQIADAEVLGYEIVTKEQYNDDNKV